MNTAHIAARRAALQAVADTRPVLTRCAYCAWRMEATLGECRKAYEQHRQDAHPWLPDPRPRKQIRNLANWTQRALRKEEQAEVDAERVRRARETGVNVNEAA